MRVVNRIVAGLVSSACALALGALSENLYAQAKPKLTKAVQKSLAAAQEAMKKKNYGECTAKAREAEAASSGSADDNFAIAEIMSFCLLQQRDYAAAAKYIEMSLESGKLASDQVPAKV
ncbi:MAG: hypothetical protein NZM12_08350, partial [Steroidobacteraceae bacterium]|nr:hypothetical protein [Steroidobacteraceae bacterium]